MLSKKHCAHQLLLKGFGSTLLMSVSHISTSASSQQAIGTLADTTATKTTLPTEKTPRSLKIKLLLKEEKYSKQLHKWSTTAEPIKPSLPRNDLRQHLQNNEHAKFLVELLLECKSDEGFANRMFSEKLITKLEYSVFINKLLSNTNLKSELTNLIPGTAHTEVLFKLYEIYRDSVVGNATLTPVQLYDLNQFIKRFTGDAQLAKAQQVLGFVLENYGSIPRDPQTLINYLELKCGAMPRNWSIPLSRPELGKTLGSQSFMSNLAHSYKALETEALLPLIDEMMKDRAWHYKRNCDLEAAVIYSLGYMGQFALLERYIKHTWGVPVSSNTSTEVEVPKNLYPTSNLLISIVSCYAMKGNLHQALQIIDSFLSKFPQIELEPLFWRRLFQWSTRLWNQKTDPKGELSNGCWQVMKQWHNKQKRSLPIDLGILNERYYVLKRTNNFTEALRIHDEALAGLYMKRNLIDPEVDVIKKFQKLILKKMAGRGYYHKPLKYISEWCLNKRNELEMREYFDRHRKAYITRIEQRKQKQEITQVTFDAEEEDDMLLGRLW